METGEAGEIDDLEVFRVAELKYYLPLGASTSGCRPFFASHSAPRTNGFDTTVPARVISTIGRFCSFMLSMPFSTSCMSAVYIPITILLLNTTCIPSLLRIHYKVLQRNTKLC